MIDRCFRDGHSCYHVWRINFKCALIEIRSPRGIFLYPESIARTRVRAQSQGTHPKPGSENLEVIVMTLEANQCVIPWACVFFLVCRR